MYTLCTTAGTGATTGVAGAGATTGVAGAGATEQSSPSTQGAWTGMFVAATRNPNASDM